MTLKSAIAQAAHDAGFDLFGVTSAEPFEAERDALRDWLDKGHAADMAWIGHGLERRLNPRKVLPSARSIVCLGISYWDSGDTDFGDMCSIPRGKASIAEEPVAELSNVSPKFGRVARYAWGKDYHKVLGKKLKALCAEIIALAGPGTECRSYTDTGAILETKAAQRAGLGFVGKNTLLLHPRHGSYFLLAEILTNLALPADTPLQRDCGSCRACLDACPTQAFVGPYELDANRCISYQTIESRKEIPADLQEALGDHVFGCDVCQEVCPYNHGPLPTRCDQFRRDAGTGPRLDLTELQATTPEAFRARFGQTALTRPKHSGMMRNAKAVASNLCQPS